MNAKKRGWFIGKASPDRTGSSLSALDRQALRDKLAIDVDWYEMNGGKIDRLRCDQLENEPGTRRKTFIPPARGNNH